MPSSAPCWTLELVWIVSQNRHQSLVNGHLKVWSIRSKSTHAVDKKLNPEGQLTKITEQTQKV